MPKTHTLAETYNKKARSKDTMTIQLFSGNAK